MHQYNGKWRGEYPDVSQRNGKKPKLLVTKCFDTEAEAERALEALVASTEAKKAALLHELAQQLDHTRDLPLRPPNAADAEPRTAYYGAKQKKEKGAEAKEFVPERYVRGGAGKGKFGMFHSCRHGIGALHACTNVVQGGGDVPYCKAHGGGHRCPGKPGLHACPLGNSIQVSESDRQVRYLKDGVQYCSACFCEAFPDDELTKNAKRLVHAKEQAVRAFLEERFATSHPGLKWVMDRRVDGTRRRPDHRPLIHLLGIRSHDLVLETDENSHWFYLCADERDKERAIHYWLNGRKKPLFFVRFNPDAYDDAATGKRVPSCWGMGGDGVPRVKPRKRAEWAARLDKLAQIVEAYLVDFTEEWAAWAEADRPTPELHAIELFYDDVVVRKGAATRALDGIKASAVVSRKRKKANTGTSADAVAALRWDSDDDE